MIDLGTVAGLRQHEQREAGETRVAEVGRNERYACPFN
jgi:hypothetical protein